MKFAGRYFSLHAAIVWFVCIVMILAFTVTGFLISKEVAERTRKDVAEKTLNVARMVGHSPIVINGLQYKSQEDELQKFAERIRKLTDVRFVVVMNMEGIRKTHPDPWKVGKHFVGGDEERALEGEEYTSIAEGTLGASLRAFEPIYNHNNVQVGAVSVGVLLNKVNRAVNRSKQIIYVGVGLGVVVGIIGALFLANRVKKVLFGLEPYEIAGIMQERNAMIESVREGILAINQNREIIIANAEATRMFEKAGIQGNPVGMTIEEYMPFSRLVNVLENGKGEFDQERNIEEVTFVVNRVPVKVDGQIVGAIATFRDRTELKHLAEQLTGVKLYAEALRVRSHEFMNKLHVILGMVYIGEYEKLTSYIHQITENQKMEFDSISRFVKDPVLAGFLLSKMSYAREQGVNLTVQGETVLPKPNNPEIMDGVITVVGNLIDNSIEAVQDFNNKNIDVVIDYDGEFLLFDVVDNKGGIPVEIRKKIFKKGFSTKGNNRGYGLFLVRKTVQSMDGDVELFTNDEYTMFSVELPYDCKEESA
ncbi:DcuS/MalK family sensor histidine kinase [Halobacillus naozhouensis]|uniref:histidine kinase n=1 Tax=Halobacillus naozhouensis TaxID=554880 RepID=A0ABY8J2V0_9BACI|nr:DcuS/MalK family sensor histidine kinase [Halobacillus naozhouensis]WFT76817.1 DcuS/MalK family sensor histidine kinase [Halobacillus naozhouensis]